MNKVDLYNHLVKVWEVDDGDLAEELSRTVLDYHKIEYDEDLGLFPD